MKLNFFVFLLFFQLSAYAQLPKLVVPSGHTNPVVALEVTPGGSFMYSTDGSKEVTVWDFKTTRIVSFLEGHEAGVNTLALSAEGKLLASGDADGKLIIRNESDWKILKITEAGAPIAKVSFEQGGKRIAVLTSTGILQLINASSGAVEQSIERPASSISSFCWLGAGQVGLGLKNGWFEVYDLTENKAVVSIQISEKAIAALAADGTATCWAGTSEGELVGIENGTAIKGIKTPLTRLTGIWVFGNAIVATGRGSETNIHFYSPSDGTEISGKLKLPAALKQQSAFAVGIQTLDFSAETVLVPDYEGGIQQYNFGTGELAARYTGQAAKIHSLAINRQGDQLAIGSSRGVALMDLAGRADPKRLKNVSAPVVGLSYGSNPYLLAGIQENSLLTVWDTQYDAVTFSQSTNEKPVFPYLAINNNDEQLIKKVEKGTGVFFIKSAEKPKIIKLKESYDQRLTPDGKYLLAQDGNTGITFYDAESFKKVRTLKAEGLQYFEISPDGRWLTALIKNGGTWLQLLDYATGKAAKQIQVPAGKSVTRMQFDPTGRYIVTLSNVVSKGSTKGDFSVTFWDISKEQEAFKLSGHSAAVSGLAFTPDGSILFSAGYDGLIKCWSVEGQNELATIVPLGDTDWAVVTPDGLFDASGEAMVGLHYAHGKEAIALEQLKGSFYEPYLLPKLLGFHKEPIRQTPRLEGFDLYPEVKLAHPEQNNGMLGINLNDQGGGIGRIVILINGKEVINEARGVEKTVEGFANFDYNIENHPYIRKGDLNKITVKAYNQQGYLSSPEKSVYLVDDSRPGEEAKPRIFGLVAGVSDYQGNGLDLKFAAKDAEDFHNALKLSAESHFGKENVNLQLLTTLQGHQIPSKQNILKAAETIKNAATANDYLVIYLSGHGVTENGDFYYLTADASDTKASGALENATYSLSSRELTTLVSSIPATRQVLVIDACHSGQLAQNLGSSGFSVSSDEARALETLKDRTGLYIIAGSAADAVSYEASAFDQGLLTYSLLYGMKGPALREDRYIDIIGLFNFASKKVPELASEIGGIQKPEVRVPNDLRTFDIGELSTELRSQIVLKSSRPPVAASAFQNEATFTDDLQIGELIDQRLKQIERGNSDKGLLFVDQKSFPEAYVVRGRYSETTTGISAVGAVFKGKAKLADIEASAASRDEVIDLLMAKIMQVIE